MSRNAQKTEIVEIGNRSHRLRRSLRAWLVETPGIVLFSLVIPLLPRCAILAFARWSGALTYRFAGKLRRIAHANLDIAFADTMSAQKKEAVARESFVTAARVFLDLLWFSRWTRRRLSRWTQLDDEFYQHVVKEQQVLVSAHFGNWEIMCLLLPLYGRGAVVVKEIKNAAANRLINRIRACTGLTTIPVQGALRPLLKEIRAGGSPALLLDQDVPPQDGGFFLDFFGLPASVSGAAALLSQRGSVVVRPFFCRMNPDGHYACYFKPGLHPASDESVEDYTERIMAILQDEIRAYPECWLWMYKRWKRCPAERSRADYPFYTSHKAAPMHSDDEAHAGLRRKEGRVRQEGRVRKLG